MSKIYITLSRSLLLLAIFCTAPDLSAQYRGGSGDGSFTASATSAIAPLDLLSFTARAESPAVSLSWRTANEFDVRHFAVERSTDGMKFVRIGTVTARGNTQPGVEADYAFTDAHAPGGELYYRLILVDLDGSSKRSPVVSVSTEAAVATVDIFPNPSQGNTVHLRINSVANRNPLRVEILDATGRQMLERHELNPADGETSLHLRRALRPGSYLVRFYAARQALPPRLLIVAE